MELRTLHPETDERLYRIAWDWRRSYPRRVREFDMLKHFRQWFALMKRRVSIGVFTDHLIAIVTLRPDGNDIYEVHVDCQRGADTNDLLIALLSMEKVVFGEWKAREVFAGIVSRNYATIRLAETCGFQRDGVEERMGRLRWVRMRKTANEFHENKHWHIDQHSDIRETARREFT